MAFEKRDCDTITFWSFALTDLFDKNNLRYVNDRVRNTSHRLFISHTLSSLWPVREYVNWRDGDPYFER